MKLLRSANFLTSCAKPLQFPPPTGPEVAFAGRSNAGKSSTLNRICDHKGLARVSATPGRTQLINFFSLNNETYLVDLPGYGYAKAPMREIRQWQALIEAYMVKRESLRGLVIVSDIRREFGEKDRQMLDWCHHRGLESHILLNKADKLNRNSVVQSLRKTEQALKNSYDRVSVQAFSASNGQGIDELHAKLTEWLIP